MMRVYAVRNSISELDNHGHRSMLSGYNPYDIDRTRSRLAGHREVRGPTTYRSIIRDLTTWRIAAGDLWAKPVCREVEHIRSGLQALSLPLFITSTASNRLYRTNRSPKTAKRMCKRGRHRRAQTQLCRESVSRCSLQQASRFEDASQVTRGYYA